MLRFYPPVEITGDTAQDTQALQNRLEEAIRADPGQWLWIHRRWGDTAGGRAGNLLVGAGALTRRRGDAEEPLVGGWARRFGVPDFPWVGAAEGAEESA